MSKLIARVVVTVMVDGARRDFQPGEELPDLPEHDVTALKAMGAAEDPDETAQAEKALAAKERRAQADFKSARAAVQAQQQSIAPPTAAN